LFRKSRFLNTIVKLGLGVLALVLLCTYVGAVSGAISPGTSQIRNGTAEISYADFISIMLTAVSLLVTVLAFVLAALAYIGWNSISAKVSDEVRANFERGFEPGGKLHKMFAEEKNKIPYKGTEQIDEQLEVDFKAEGEDEDEY
jgi:hypothetical protein